MTLNQFIKQTLAHVMRDGFTPESIALFADQYRKLASAGAFGRTPRQAIEPYLNAIFKREVTSGRLLERNKGIDTFTYERIKPQFRQLLEDRIRANIDLIVLERNTAIDISTNRFSGWLMSFDGVQQKLPQAKDLPVFKNITKPMQKQKDYEHRRRSIDQGHKMIAAINSVVAEQGGAIAAVWHSHKKTDYYDARPEHTKRDGVVYCYKTSPATVRGLVKKGNEPWVEDLPDPPALLINCTCYFTQIYNVSELAKIAPDRLTDKAKELMK